jgi:hypothetical protein
MFYSCPYRKVASDRLSLEKHSKIACIMKLCTVVTTDTPSKEEQSERKSRDNRDTETRVQGVYPVFGSVPLPLQYFRAPDWRDKNTTVRSSISYRATGAIVITEQRKYFLKRVEGKGLGEIGRMGGVRGGGKTMDY